MPVFQILVLIGLASLYAQAPGYGDPPANYPSFPSWRERGVLTLTNACRMDPTGYRDKYVGPYNILLPQNYPAQNPVYWNIDLNRAARFHAGEMADLCGMQHPSCNGTAWNVRVSSYYTKSGTLAENIASGYGAPQQTVRQWLLDSATTIATDKSSGDGHRANIMSNKYRELGAGYDSGVVKWYHFWVQDFGGGKPDAYPIPSASHLFLETNKTTFMANFFDSLGEPPQEASVTVGGQKTSLTLLLGTAARGSYAVALPKAAACRPYFFTFRDGRGVSWRFPAGGTLVTFGEGGCDSQYIAPQIAVEKAKEDLFLDVNASLSFGPNPFSVFANVSYRVRNAGPVAVEIWDASGKKKATLSHGPRGPGEYSVEWAPLGFPSGVYFAVLRTGRRVEVQKVVYIP